MMEFLGRAGQPPSLYKVASASLLHDSQYFRLSQLPSQQPGPRIPCGSGLPGLVCSWGGTWPPWFLQVPKTCISARYLLIGVLADGHAAAVAVQFPGTASLAGAKSSGVAHSRTFPLRLRRRSMLADPRLATIGGLHMQGGTGIEF